MSRFGERTSVGTSRKVAGLGKPPAGNSYGVATGGTSSSITVSSQVYTMLTFTSSDTLTVTKSGLFDFVTIGGGGSGGNVSGEQGGGGGGGGGWRQSTIFLDANVTVTIGAGAAGAGASGQAVGNQSFVGDQIISIGGGRGGTYDYFNNGSNNNLAANAGGQNTNANAGATAWVGGFAGGARTDVFDYYRAGGGGGGSAAVGLQGTASGGAIGGAGGAGKDFSTFRGEVASTTFYGGGGGGGVGLTGGTSTGGVGGAGGGGRGNRNNSGGAAGSANTGGGGGGGGISAGSADGLSGGSGIVLVRFKV